MEDISPSSSSSSSSSSSVPSKTGVARGTSTRAASSTGTDGSPPSSPLRIDLYLVRHGETTANAAKIKVIFMLIAIIFMSYPVYD